LRLGAECHLEFTKRGDMKLSQAIRTARMAGFPAILISAVVTTTTITGGNAPAQAAARIIPKPAALVNHTYVKTFKPAELYGWRYPTNDPGNCTPNPSEVSNAGSAVVVKTTGANGDCTSIESLHTYPVSDGYVYEAKVYFSAIPGTKQFADWNSFWMYGSDWPVDGEVDAVETTFGTQFVSYHYGTRNSEVSTCNRSNGCDFSAGAITAKSANIEPGWHIVDIAYGDHRIQIFYDGHLYTTIAGRFVNPKPAWITFSAGSSRLMDRVNVPGEVKVQWLRVFK
jgi:hypothetical protein